jgi:hypothetical protein
MEARTNKYGCYSEGTTLAVVVSMSNGRMDYQQTFEFLDADEGTAVFERILHESQLVSAPLASLRNLIGEN